MEIPPFSDIKRWEDLTKAHLERALTDSNRCLDLFGHMLKISELGRDEARILRFLKLMARRSWDGDFQVKIQASHVLGQTIVALFRISGGLTQVLRRYRSEVSFLEFKRAALESERIAPLVQVPREEKHILCFIAPHGRTLMPPRLQRPLASEQAPLTPRISTEIPSAALPSRREAAMVSPTTSPADEIDAGWES